MRLARPRLRLLGALLCLLALLVCIADPAGGEGTRATRSTPASELALPPACAKGQAPPPNPVQPACVHGPWASPYASAIDGSVLVRKAYVSPSAGRAFWSVSVAIRYGAPLPTCPKPTPAADIPCQEPGQSVFDYGVFVPGRSDLQPLPPGVTGVVGEPDGSCSLERHTCLMSFYVFPDAFHGSLVMVWGVLVGDLTRNPQGAGPSPAGFEFPVSVEIPPPKE